MESKEELKQNEEENTVDVDDEKPVEKLIKKTVQYCQVCSMPPEYCMYQSNTKARKCQEWLRINSPAQFHKFYVVPELKRQAEEAAKAKEAGSESGVPAVEGAEEAKEPVSTAITEAAKTEAPVEQAELTPEEIEKQELLRQKQNAKFMMQLHGEDNKITVLTTRRKFKKFITVVTGLNKYGISLKDAAKVFRHKFACGAKDEGEEVEIQGEFDDVIADFICKEWKQVPRGAFVYKKDAPKPKEEQPAVGTKPAPPKKK